MARGENLAGTISDLPRSDPPRASQKRWRWLTLAIVAIVAFAFLFTASHQQSPWHVSIDLTNWRIYASEALEFHQGGLTVHTTKKHYIGPIVISSERAWNAQQAHPAIDSNLDR